MESSLPKKYNEEKIQGKKKGKKILFKLRDDLQDMRSSIYTHLTFHPLRNFFIPSISNPRKIWREVYLWNNGLVNHHLLLRWHKWKGKHFYLSKLFGDVDNESIKLHTINKFRCHFFFSLYAMSLPEKCQGKKKWMINKKK